MYEPFVVSDHTILNCSSYVYLGAYITEDCKLKSALELHARQKRCHVAKYTSFVTRNRDAPFWIKKTVLDSALMSAILYDCESWMMKSLQPMNQLYTAAIKLLLGVRNTTPNDLCLVEVGYPSLSGYVRNRQVKLFTKLLRERDAMEDDPFMFTWRLVSEARTPCAQYVRALLQSPGSVIHGDMTSIRNRIRQSHGTKFITYRSEMNPQLIALRLYTTPTVIAEYKRIAFSQLRLSAHRLAIETGRWSRLPRERRLCSCGDVQTESHVLCVCVETEQLRQNCNIMFALPQLFECESDTVCSYIHSCFRILNL